MASTARALNWVYRMAVPASAGAFLVSQSLFDVKGGTRAVIFDVRTKPRNIATTTGSKDLQMVSLTLRVLHRPNVKALPKIYQVSTAAERMKRCEDMKLTDAEPRCRLR